LIDDDSVRELDKWHADVEGALKDTRDHRPEYERIFQASGSRWPEALRRRCAIPQWAHIYEPSLSDILERATGAFRTLGVGRVVGYLAPLALLLHGMGIRHLCRNMREENYSHEGTQG